MRMLNLFQACLNLADVEFSYLYICLTFTLLTEMLFLLKNIYSTFIKLNKKSINKRKHFQLNCIKI